ncbi:hypothetical protein EYV94_01410 [Puteibacter caeruleilacunae]|nr:hypothetical protein EYV94_01410 [Puteibacter caeruleilacunae]
MMKRTLVLALILAVQLTAFAKGKQSVYQVKSIGEDKALSSLVDANVWNKAGVMTLRETVTGSTDVLSTKVRLLYSNTHLYIRFECEDPYIWGTHTERDSPIFNEECVEVFLDPAQCGHQYFEINLSPKNVTFESCVLTHRTEKEPGNKFLGNRTYNPELKTLVTKTKDGWIGMYAIPFKDLYGNPTVVPQKGDKWNANFYRIDKLKDKPTTYDAWQPTGKVDFHRPWVFGTLLFK